MNYDPDKTVSDILNGSETINRDLYEYYSGGLRKAIEMVYHESGGEVYKANVSRFAAYKAYQATRLARREVVNKETGEILPREQTAKDTLNVFKSYQTAEVNTAVTRARTAKQWETFSQPNRLRLFPNVRWVPSRSVERRAQHVKFYNRVWAKNDPFWQQNAPGSLWNCKCDMQETRTEITENDDIPTFKALPGLEGNPAMTGEIFTDNASYIARTNTKIKPEIELFAKVEYNRYQYNNYKSNKDYKDIHFDENTGGLMATHINHNFSKNAVVYEKEAQNILYAEGNSVVMFSERAELNVKTPDGLLNQSVFDVKTVLGDSGKLGKNNLKNKLIEANSQGCKIAVLYFPKSHLYEGNEQIQNAISRYLYNCKSDKVIPLIKEVWVIDGRQIKKFKVKP